MRTRHCHNAVYVLVRGGSLHTVTTTGSGLQTTYVQSALAPGLLILVRHTRSNFAGLPKGAERSAQPREVGPLEARVCR